MNTFKTNPAAIEVKVDDDTIWARLADGREIRVPIAWFPRLANASPEDRRIFEFDDIGIHWPKVDEDLSIAGFLRL
jgi:hypothetical protein